MCGGSPKTPEVVRVDPKAEADKAAADAAAAANAEAAARRTSKRRASLSTGAGVDNADAASAVSAGKSVLGG